MILPFRLDRPLAFLDLETTGLSTVSDRIIELAVIRVTPQGDVLEAVRRFNPHLPRTLDGLHAYCDEVSPFQTELDRWFHQRDGEFVFRRGKHRGTPLQKVAATEPDYLRWMLGTEDMDDEVLQVVRAALEGQC
jgi:hypothetical protein